jgi:ribosome maturation protein SDO1
MIKNPVNIKLLTNVAVVRLKKGKRHFELAAYRNKVINWRNKQENDLSEVLQIDQIFADVAKGIKATKEDLKTAFGKMGHDDIVMEILNKGDFQLGELEREEQFESLKLEIANLIVKMCVNSETGGQFPVSIIQKAMVEANCKLNPNKAAKPQALAFVNELKVVLPIKRASMHLKISFVNALQQAKLTKNLLQLNEKEIAVSKV